MTRTTSPSVALGVALLLLSAPLVGLGAAASGSTHATTPTTVTSVAENNSTNEYGYTLPELESSGDIREEDMPSVRVLSKYQYLWALDYKVGIREQYGKETSEQWLEPGMTVNRNKFQLQGNFPYDGENRQFDVEVVYYEPDTRRIQTQNGTTTERYANISAVDRQTLTFEPGLESSANVTLRPHYESATKMAVFLLDEDGDRAAKWGPYTHSSVQTTAEVPFSTWGGFVPWLIKWFVIATGVGAAFAVGGGYKLAKDTGGFGKNALWWILVTGISGGVAVSAYFAELVALIVALPFVLALPVVFGVFLVTMAITQPTFKGRLERPNITETESAVGDTRSHIEGEHADSISLFERDDGIAFIKYGSIRRALARKFAGMATVPWDEIEKRYKTSGTSPDSEKFYIKDYEFTGAHWTYDFPNLIETVTDDITGDRHREVQTDRIAAGLAVVTFGALLGAGVFGAPLIGAAVGLVPVLATGLEPHAGHIDIEFATAADISAKSARLTETEEQLKWETIDAAIADIGEARTDVWKKVQNLVQKQREERDKTAQEMYDLADGDAREGADTGSSPTVEEAMTDD